MMQFKYFCPQLKQKSKKMRRILSLVMMAAFASIAMAQQTIHITVENPANAPRTDQPVVINLAKYGQVQSALVKTDDLEIPCQLDDLDQDDNFDELCFLADLKAKEKKSYTVTLYAEGSPRQYPARVYAELLVRNSKVKEKNKHNNFLESITARGDCADPYHILHHHGVEFESELNGIRIYFDKRQTIDLYGKLQKRLELQETQFYTTKEQKAEGYGEGRGLWRRCAVGGQHVRTRRLPRMGWSAAHDDRPRSQSHPAHHLLRSFAHHRRNHR